MQKNPQMENNPLIPELETLGRGFDLRSGKQGEPREPLYPEDFNGNAEGYFSSADYSYPAALRVVPEKKTFIEGCSNKDSATAILEILKAVGVKDPATYMPTYFANLTSASYWETQKVFVVVVYIHYSMEVPANTRAKDISTYFKDKFSSLLKANTDAARLKLIELFGTHYIQKLSIGGAFVISADASSNSAKNDLLDYVYYLCGRGDQEMPKRFPTSCANPEIKVYGAGEDLLRPLSILSKENVQRWLQLVKEEPKALPHTYTLIRLSSLLSVDGGHTPVALASAGLNVTPEVVQTFDNFLEQSLAPPSKGGCVLF